MERQIRRVFRKSRGQSSGAICGHVRKFPVGAGNWAERQLCCIRTRSSSAGKSRAPLEHWGSGAIGGPERRLSLSQCQGPDKLAGQCRRAPEKNPRASFLIILGHCTVKVVSKKSRNVQDSL